MQFLVASPVLAGLSQAAPQFSPRALIPDVLEQRDLPTCAHDNLFRIFLDARYSSSASVFCSTYITGTSVSTIMPLTTATSYRSLTDVTSTSTSILLSIKTLTTSTSARPTITLTPKVKRQAVEGAPGKAGTYPPGRISSACSCLVTPEVVISQTTTATSTTTLASTLHFTKATTVTKKSTTTLNVVGPATTTATVHVPAAPPSYCVDGIIVAGGSSFATLCGSSYAPVDIDLATVLTVALYADCAAACDSNAECIYFSYQLTAASNNCIIMPGYGAVIVDLNVNSGMRL